MTVTHPPQARTEEPPPYSASPPGAEPTRCLSTSELFRQVAEVSPSPECPLDILGTLRELSRPERQRVEMALELARRIAEAEVMRRSEPLTNSVDLHRFLSLEVAALDHEVFGVVYLDGRNRVIHAGTLFRGSLTSCSVHPREILRQVMDLTARAVILYHNHPSGNPQPSEDDRTLTRQISAALQPISVPVLDHLILGDQCRVYSFADQGCLD